MSDDERTLRIDVTHDFTRQMFDELCTIPVLPDGLHYLFVAIGGKMAQWDLGAKPGDVMPAAYMHPTDLRFHHMNHSEQGTDCPCHPDDRSQCEACNFHIQLLAFES